MGCDLAGGAGGGFGDLSYLVVWLLCCCCLVVVAQASGIFKALDLITPILYSKRGLIENRSN